MDESGLLMAPLVRRSWAPRGEPPDLDQCGGRRQKVSVAAALWLSPRRDRLGLYAKTLVDAYFDNWSVAAFLEALLHDLPGRFVVVWDGGPMHKGDPIRQLASYFTDRLTLESLPPWAPELNPVEPVWIYSSQYPSGHTLRPGRRDAHNPRRGAAPIGRLLPVSAH